MYFFVTPWQVQSTHGQILFYSHFPLHIQHASALQKVSKTWSNHCVDVDTPEALFQNTASFLSCSVPSLHHQIYIQSNPSESLPKVTARRGNSFTSKLLVRADLPRQRLFLANNSHSSVHDGWNQAWSGVPGRAVRLRQSSRHRRHGEII